ncbi:MAG: NADH-quinone oxidoreductase subunit NuoK [Candidatus Omnitrophota bacterium]|jgi:NADH-quinone oxidoreductase subunit K
MIPAAHGLILAGLLFTLGLLGVLIRRNILMILLAIELMLNAANLVLVVGSSVTGNLTGQLMAFFVMVIAAAEVTIGLAIAVLLFRKQGSLDTSEMTWMKG